jgi:hypothetical protein
MQTRYFALFFVFYIALVSSLAYLVPIAPHEAKIFFTSNDIVSQLMHIGNSYFYGTFGIRIFFIFASILSIGLFYIVAKDYLKNSHDAMNATTIFAFLPAIIIAGAVANISILILLFLLLYLIAHNRKWYPFELLSATALWYISDGSIIFFVALIFYSIMVREWRTLVIGILFISILYFQHRWIEVGGKPIGHLVETFGLYGTVFTPFLFLFFIFTIHSIWLREPKNIIGYISFTAFLISMLLSIRQRIIIVDFAPYMLIAIMPMLARYLTSLRVRLPQFQSRYKKGFWLSISFLFIGLFIIISTPITFYITNKSPYSFTNKIYKPYLLAKKLKKEKKQYYATKESKERYQLQFYNINPCK